VKGAAAGIALAACATAIVTLLLLAGCEDVADDRAAEHDAITPASVEDPVGEEPGDAFGGNGEAPPADVAARVDVAEPEDLAEPVNIAERDAESAEPSPEQDAAPAVSAAAAEGTATTPAAAPQRIDPRALFIDAAPVPRAALAPQLASQLDEVRRAMRQREFLAIRQHLQASAADRRSGADRQAYERMLLVHALWTQGWSHALAAAGELGPGDRIDTWAGPALVQDKTDREIMLRIDGDPQTFSTRIGDMEIRLAAALVEHRARDTGLALDAHIAALWTFAPEAADDGEDPIEAAEEAIIEAAQRGAYVDDLITELAIRRSE
jgi:hypothetical protein